MSHVVTTNDVYRQVPGRPWGSVPPLSGHLSLDPPNKSCSSLLMEINGETCRRSCWMVLENSTSGLKVFPGSCALLCILSLKAKELVLFIFNGSPHSIKGFWGLSRACVRPESHLNCFICYFLKMGK